MNGAPYQHPTFPLHRGGIWSGAELNIVISIISPVYGPGPFIFGTALTGGTGPTQKIVVLKTAVESV